MFLQIALSKSVRATISSEKFNNFPLLLCRNVDLYEINRLILTKLWYCQTLVRKRAVGRILTKNTCSVNSRQKPRFLEEFKFLHTKTDVSPNRSFEISPSDDFFRKIQYFSVTSVQKRRFIWNQASYTYEIVILPKAGSKTCGKTNSYEKFIFC